MIKSFFQERFTEICITAIALICCCCFFTIVDDDEVGSVIQGMAAGQFSNFSFIDFCFLSFVGVNAVYKYLYHLFPAYNWLGIAFLGFQYLSLYLVLRTIRKLMAGFEYKAKAILFVQILFALFFIDNIVTVTHTRFALIFCGISLINLVFVPTVRKRDILINTFIFIFAMLHRPESGLGMLLLVSVGYLIYKFDIIFLAKRIFFPAGFAVLMFGYIAYDWTQTDVYVKKIEPEIEYKLMDNRVVPLSAMHSEADSIKYNIGVQAMWFDPRVITPDFLRSILLPGMDLTPGHAQAVLVHVLSFFRFYSFIPCILVILLSFCFIQPGFRKTGGLILLYQMVTFLIIYYLDYNGLLVANRHFLNLQLISLLIVFYYAFSARIPFALFAKRKILLLVYVVLMLTGIFQSIGNYSNYNRMIVKNVEETERVMDTLESKYQGRTIAVTLGAIHFFDHNFSIRNKKYTKNDYVLFDIFTFQLMPRYIDYLNQKCNCDAMNPTAFFDWLSTEKALYMNEPWRYKLTEDYMRIIHKDSISFVNPVNIYSLSGVNNLSTHTCEIREVIKK